MATDAFRLDRSKAGRALSTIQVRLFLPYAITLLLGTVIAWWIGTNVLHNTLEARVLQQLDQAAAVISQPGFPVTGAVLTRLNRLLDISLYLFDQDGKLLLHDEITPPGQQPVKAIQGYFETWQQQGNTREAIHFSADSHDYLMVIQKPEGSSLRDYTAVAVLADLSDVRKATRYGGLWLATLAAGSISILAFLGHRIARSITLPVSELAHMAGLIAAGDRSVRVNIHRQDEIGALAQSLNTMAERLGRYEHQVADQSRLLTLSEMSARVAHEIRNPLTAIKMQLQLLQDDVPRSSEQRLALLLDEVRRLELIVATTLQLGRPEQLTTTLLNLNDLVREVLDLVAPQFQHRGIAMSTDLTEGLPLCPLDADRVKQILLNLLNNAADELPHGGRIRVATRRPADRTVALEVADSGPGIPRERWQSVFEQSSSDKPNGFGLGLRVTRELVELHGGDIEIAESGLGGILIRVIFPTEH